MKYFSMFTGVGGFELGIGDKGKCIGFSEIDKYASELLANKWPEIRNYGDATKIDPNELPDFDMLCGGFPCQSFSIAGKRKGFEDTRGTMFFEISRILKIKRPRIVFLENVKGLLNHNKGETFKVIIQTLQELGYDVQWMVLNSKFHGVPQNRERVFIIGNLRGTSRSEILPLEENDGQTFEQIGRSSEVSNTISARYFKQGNADTYIKYFNMSKTQHDRIYREDGISPTLAGASKLSGDCTPKIVIPQVHPTIRANHHNTANVHVIPVLTPDRLNKRQNGRRFKEDGEESFTITKTDIHGVMLHSSERNSGSVMSNDSVIYFNSPNYFKIRRLTPIECERLQGFPDNWTEGFSDTQRYKMMGNAVTVNVIKVIAEKLK